MERTADKSEINQIKTPQYYSPSAILIFSVLFSVIYGSVLFSFNLANKKNKISIIVLSILYWTLGFILFRQTSYPELIFIFNCIGAFILAKPIWNLYISKDIKFRPKPIKGLLIISILIGIVVTLGIMFVNPETKVFP